MIGHQSVAIRNLSETRLELHLSGPVQLPVTAMRYRCLPTGEVQLDMPPPVRRLLHELHARFDGATYVSTLDHATFSVAPFGLHAVRVHLARVAAAA